MTPRERINAALRHEEPDRIPVDLGASESSGIMGIAYNAHYLTWFEIGRTEFMRSAGFPYRQVEERGIRLPLVEASFRLRHTLAYDDVIVTRTWIDGLRSRTVAFAYEILHDGRTAATGRTLHACVDAASGRGVSFPAWLKSKIAPLSD